MSLGANEEMPVNVVTKTAAKVTHEMIAADEVCAGESATTEERLVKTQALPTDSSHHFSACVLAKFRRIDSIEIVKQGTIGLEAGIEIATGSPREFAAHAKITSQEKIRAENWVGASGL